MYSRHALVERLDHCALMSFVASMLSVHILLVQQMIRTVGGFLFSIQHKRNMAVSNTVTAALQIYYYLNYDYLI